MSQNPKTEYNAGAPAVTDDIDSRFQVGDIWIDNTNGDRYRCEDPSAGAAVWVKIEDDPHGQKHEENGSDELFVENLGTAEVNPIYFYRADGLGGVVADLVPGSPGGDPASGVKGQVVRCQLEYVGPSQILVGEAGKESTAVSSDDTLVMEFSGQILLDLTVSGIGGLDTGVEAPSTWYCVHVIGDSNNVNPTTAILSAGPGPVTYPPGYDKERRVGWIYNKADSNIRLFVQFGTGLARIYEWVENRTDLQVLNGGNATVWATVSCAAFLPPSVQEVPFFLEFTPKNAGNRAFIRATNSGLTDPVFQVNGENANGDFTSFGPAFTDANQDFDYQVSKNTDALDVYVPSFTDNL